MRRFILTLFLVLASFGVGVAVSWRHFHRAASGAPLIASTTTSTTQVTAPLLRETFTLLACNANTTLGMEGCAEHKIVSLDSQINGLNREILRRLYDKQARQQFVTAETDWYTYRQSTCASDSNKYQGGSLAPVDFANCVVRINQQHVTALTSLLASY
ncbi:MAG TPA: lysozyme inhibitor LprI family protein [Acidimicrobiales bacterium]